MWSQEMKNGRVQFFERYEDPLTGKKKIASVTADKLTNATKKSAQERLRRKILEKTNKPAAGRPNTLKNIMDAYPECQARTLKPDTLGRNRRVLRATVDAIVGDVLAKRLTAPRSPKNRRPAMKWHFTELCAKNRLLTSHKKLCRCYVKVVQFLRIYHI